MGDLKGTERTLMEIMNRGRPLDDLVGQLGSVMLLQKMPEAEVAKRYEEILKRQPQLSRARATLAGFYMGSQKKDEAMRLFEEGLAARPGDALVRMEFGVFLGGLRQMDRGMAMLEEAVRIARGEVKGMRVREDPQALHKIASVYDNLLKRPDLAIPQLEHLAEMKPPKRPPGVVADLAFAEFRAGVLAGAKENEERAIETMKRAAAEDPDNPTVAANVAEMYRAVQRPSDAGEWDAKAAERAKRLQEQQARRVKMIHAWRSR
jgi:tetratricopeptide (TPR) repeat protein